MKEERNVWTEFNGGVGNQLFQLAMGYSFSEKFNYVLNLDLRGCDSSQSDYCSFHLQSLIKYFPVNKVLRYRSWSERFLSKAKAIRQKPTFISRTEAIDSFLGHEIPRSVFLSHYEDRFFAQRANDYGFDLLLSRFRVEMSTDRHVTTLEDQTYSSYDLNGFVGLHLRGRDFLGSSHFTELEWYLDVISSYLKGEQILIFTDDVAIGNLLAARCNLAKVVKQSQNPIMDLIMASYCGALILSKSSFSFWISNFAETQKIYSPIPYNDIFAPIHPFVSVSNANK